MTYVEARKLIVPLLVQTYAEAAKPSIINNSTQTDENITQIKCPPLNLLQPLRKPKTSPTTPAVTTSSSTQAQLLRSTSSKTTTVSEPQPYIPVSCDVLSTTENMFTSIKASSVMSASSSNSNNQNPSDSTIKQNLKKKKFGIKKGKKNC
ncbi:hypothetical protein TNCV_2607741 [Trichonephila clavipes]|uniref:Uncharacterized protein n=1 Tax=Trichonephila clavipes TaxID=2585209 RepID=A0A8X6RZ63_TRICX|nr:hypothetical protein TNCV_2607741 [Trichonephila clavipes]